uniref:Uncharacterized protein n=1 Tax=Haplochromis burtoni TaxID=8153 RepID=A0A3Q3CCG9_HAPBU
MCRICFINYIQKNQNLRCSFKKLSYLDSSTPAFTNSIGHSSTRRVNHGHEASKAQVLSGEVHIISVKSKAFFELVIRQVIVAETYKAQIKCD